MFEGQYLRYCRLSKPLKIIRRLNVHLYGISLSLPEFSKDKEGIHHSTNVSIHNSLSLSTSPITIITTIPKLFVTDDLQPPAWFPRSKPTRHTL